jgi:polysaccharide export outer membrane protein
MNSHKKSTFPTVARINPFFRISPTFLLLLLSIIVIIASSGTVCAATPYTLGPEDVITITVVGHPEFSGDVFIPTDGNVDLPGIGHRMLGGKTLAEVITTVSDALKERLLQPEVGVTLKVPRMQRIYVLGVVGKPGPCDLKPGWRIAEAVSAAGGLVPGIEPGDCKVTLLHAATGKKTEVTLTYALSGVRTQDLELNPEDVITVDAPPTIPVYVMGEVRSPGLYRVRTDSANVSSAITVAGGVLDDALLSGATIAHLSGNQDKVDLIPIIQGKVSDSPKLQAGDLITIPQSTARIAVLGYVNIPGIYQLKDGLTITLSEALGLAKGPDNRRAGLSKVAIARLENGKQEREVFNYREYLKKGDITQNPVIHPGDVIYVPETGKIDWGLLWNAASSLGSVATPFIIK